MKKRRVDKKRGFLTPFVGILGSVQDWMKGEDYHIPVDTEKLKEEDLERRKLSEGNKISRRKKGRMKGKRARKNRGKNRWKK